jgi:rhodanese-related sulfurtransferase
MPHQVRTFNVGDDTAATVESIGARIADLRTPSEYAHRHARGKEIGASLGFIIDSIERLVLPADPKAAFYLLVRVFEADGQAMENCGDHDWEVECAFKRAAELMAEAAKAVPAAEVAAKIRALMAADGYGMRGALAAVIAQADDAR